MLNISMQSNTLEPNVIERRQQSPVPVNAQNNGQNNSQDNDLNDLWDKLTLSQQFSVCSLGQFGYMLTYVRTISNRSLAILKLDKKVATVNDDGLINISPYISIRD